MAKATTGGAVRQRKAAHRGGRELERLRKICLSIEGAIEKPSHGEPTWFTGPKGKVFAMFDNHHHGAAHISVHLATPMEVQQALIASDPERYWRPPYVGHLGWTAIVLDTRPDWTAVESLLREAFQRVSSTIKRRR